jgi:hypothetical protein
MGNREVQTLQSESPFVYQDNQDQLCFQLVMELQDDYVSTSGNHVAFHPYISSYVISDLDCLP